MITDIYSQIKLFNVPQKYKQFFIADDLLSFFSQVFHESTGQQQVPPLPQLGEAQTLAEVEHRIMAREHRKPRVLTATELERQLRGEPPLPAEPRAQMSMPAPIPPVGTSVSFRNLVNE